MKFLYEIIYMIALDKELGLPVGQVTELNRIYSEKAPEKICAAVYDWKLEHQFIQVGSNRQELPIEGVAYAPSSRFTLCLDKNPVVKHEFMRIDVMGAFIFESQNTSDIDYGKLLDCKSKMLAELQKIFGDSIGNLYKLQQRINQMVERYQKFLPEKQTERK